MHRTRTGPSLFILVLLALSIQPAAAHERQPRDWVRIDVPAELTLPVNGEWRELRPGCALGDPYHFYFRPGRQDKLLVYLDGGGACWDSTSCLASLAAPQPLYDAVLDADDDPANFGGPLDAENPDNPLKDWSAVFVPYCSGDMHWGSNDAQYIDLLGNVTGTPGTPVTVHHRGFDNLMVVRAWVKFVLGFSRWRDDDDRDGIDKLLVAGSSAGAYGAPLAFPFFKDALPRAHGNLLADAGNGVVTQEFLDQAMTGLNAVWNVNGNLPPVPGFELLPSASAQDFTVSAVTALAQHYDHSRFAQYNTAWDLNQIQFLHVLENLDNPAEWANFSVATACRWHEAMQAQANRQAANGNFRYYLGAGTDHTVLVDALSPGKYYSEDSAGMAFTDWLTKMIHRQDDWDTVACSDCAPPFDPAVCSTL